MGKKDKNKGFNEDCPIPEKDCKAIADNIEGYLDLYSTYIIKDGVKEKEWDDNVKELRKMCKKIRRGDIDGIIDVDAYEELNGLPFNS